MNHVSETTKGIIMSDESCDCTKETGSDHLAGKNLDDLILDLKNTPPLSSRQRENVNRLISVSKKFHDRMGIPSPDTEHVTPETIVLESGHQPNFLPHSGILKKAYLLSRIQKQINKNGYPCVAFFGYADQNLSTAKLLYRTHIPAANKNGRDTIGFLIPESDRNKRFCSQPKPSIEAWLKGLEKIKKHYLADFAKLTNKSEKIPPQLDKILDILQISYEPAQNFAELNAIIFSRICHDIFGIQLRFFLHSELQKELLFVEESRLLLQHYRNYNKIYNQVATEKNLDIPPVHLNHLPFWYHCNCGTKIDLFIDETNVARGECPTCYRKYALALGQDFIRLPEYYARMDFNAVSRNVIWAEGLGDALFLSGAGGSLRYGVISDQVTKTLRFRHPDSLSWRSTDYYLGLTHTLVLEELGKAVSTDLCDLPQAAIREKITGIMKDLEAKITVAERSGSGDKSLKALKSHLNRLENLLSTAEKNFSQVSSAIDLLVNQNSAVPGLWEEALKKASITKNEKLNKIDADIVYPSSFVTGLSPEDIRQLYTSFRKTEAQI
ncbi:MAG: hypothetical protein ABFD66_04475 [Smithella sp.]